MKYCPEYGDEGRKLKENSAIIGANKQFQKDRPFHGQGNGQQTVFPWLTRSRGTPDTMKPGQAGNRPEQDRNLNRENGGKPNPTGKEDSD